MALLVGLTAALLAAPICVVAADKGASCALLRSSAETRSLEGCNFPGIVSDPESSARRFIDAHLGELGMLQGSAELAHAETVRGLAGQHVRFRQILAGYPVYNAFVSVAQDEQGRIRRVYSSYNASRSYALAAKRFITRDQAEQTVRQTLQQEAGGPPEHALLGGSRVVWFPRASGQLVLAWELTITAERPRGDFLAMVDIASGELLMLQNRMESYEIGRGKVFRPNPIQASGNATLNDNSSAALINGQLVEVDLPRLDPGTGLLKGRYVDVVTLKSPNWPYSDPAQFPAADESSRQYFYDLPDPRLAQVNAYYAIDSAQRYIRAHGWDDDRTIPNGIRSYVTKVNVHWDAADTSVYLPSTGEIHFGEGGVPDAEDADIVVHEYGHAIQYAQNPSWGCQYNSTYCDMRAMGEGFADYLAAAFHSRDGNALYQQSNAACVGEWDSTAYSITTPPCLRRVDGNKSYLTDRIFENHRDGEIWSRALWDIRAAIGESVANQIVLEHHFSLLPGTTMPQAALAVIAVDADLFGGAYEVALRNAFCAREILTGADCTPANDRKLIIPVLKDTFVREALPGRNDGASPRLRLKGIAGERTRILLRFDLTGIDVATVKSAVLVLTAAYSDQGWVRFGRTIDVHPLPQDFVEGNGIGAGAAEADRRPGTGSGATWNCSNDADISDSAAQCLSSPPWVNWTGGEVVGAPFGAGSQIPPVVQTSGATGRARWAVTSDLKAGVSGWAVKATFDLSGLVEYYSKEGAVAANDLTLQPRLVITFN